MRRISLFVTCAALLFSASTMGEAQSEEVVGVRAIGGNPESFFIETVPEADAAGTAEMVANALVQGRLVIFAYMKKLTDPKIGDKGFSADVFAEQWLDSMQSDLIDITPAQKRILDKVVWAGKMAMDNNQDRINAKGVGWKNFLPAKWAREAGTLLISKTGIVTNQPARHYRHPSNAPDSFELKKLKEFIHPDHNLEPYGEFAQMGKQKVYRYVEPIQVITPCLGCHGKPKGAIDVLGFEKDGLEAGDVIGLLSVTVGVQ